MLILNVIKLPLETGKKLLRTLEAIVGVIRLCFEFKFAKTSVFVSPF